MIASARKAAFLSSLGAGLEYYDFIIYGMMAEHTSLQFFSGDEPAIGLIKAFSIFAVGYLARPLGGLIFGSIGDVYGRKTTLLAVMLLMGTATLGMGLLPTYSQIGLWAPLFLLFFRLLQGISFGAELPGALTVVSEYASAKKSGIYSSFVIASTSAGSILASLVLYALTELFTKEQILNWAWRLPFCLGGALAFFSFYIRSHLHETPQFSCRQAGRLQQASCLEPLLNLWRYHRVSLARGIALTSFTASLVISALCFPAFLSEHYAYPKEQIYLGMLWSLVWSALVLPLFGLLADRFDKKALFASTLTVFIAGIFPLFELLKIGTFGSLLTFMIVYQTFIASASSCYFPIIAALFPVNVRYTGIAVCYNLAYSLMATLPLILSLLSGYNEFSVSFIWVFLLCALPALGALIKMNLTAPYRQDIF